MNFKVYNEIRKLRFHFKSNKILGDTDLLRCSQNKFLSNYLSNTIKHIASLNILYHNICEHNTLLHLFHEFFQLLFLHRLRKHIQYTLKLIIYTQLYYFAKKINTLSNKR